jgi:hypothetical protein
VQDALNTAPNRSMIIDNQHTRHVVSFPGNQPANGDVMQLKSLPARGVNILGRFEESQNFNGAKPDQASMI